MSVVNRRPAIAATFLAILAASAQRTAGPVHGWKRGQAAGELADVPGSGLAPFPLGLRLARRAQ